jgi:hypothetical protein
VCAGCSPTTETHLCLWIPPVSWMYFQLEICWCNFSYLVFCVERFLTCLFLYILLSKDR